MEVPTPGLCTPSSSTAVSSVAVPVHETVVRGGEVASANLTTRIGQGGHLTKQSSSHGAAGCIISGGT